MNILLEEISNKSLFLINFLRLFNTNINYLRIKSKEEKKLFLKLKSLGVMPLPIEDIRDIPYSEFSNLDHDPKNLILKKTESIYSKKISKLFLKNISSNSEKVIKLIIKDTIGNTFTELNAYINIWLKQKKRLIFITYSFSSLILINKNKNLTVVYLPRDFFTNILKILGKSKLIFKPFLNKFLSIFHQQKKTKKIIVREYSVAYILHGDTYYGNFNEKDALYNKTLYYSNEYKEFKKQNIIHFGYVLKKLKNRLIKYKYLSDKHLILRDFALTLVFALKSILYIRKPSDLFLIAMLTINLKYFFNCRNIFKQFPKLKIALIDYDFLCPKIIILALMSLNIKTASTQERFVSSFFNTQNILVDDYFTPSDKMNELIKKNKSIMAKNLIPVGLYRADKIFKKKNKKISKKVIVALGFQTVDTLHASQLHILLNWKASRLFLEEMFKLSQDLKNCKIIIRLKEWKEYNNPYFKKIIEKIKNKKNIEINTINKAEYSYKICSKADLIIAKPTSLADECISRNIPVIFCDYTHNINGIIRGAFNYDNSSIICNNYPDVLDKAKRFLNIKNNDLKEKFQTVKDKYYYYDEKITVKNKILNHLNNYLVLKNIIKKNN